MSFGEFLFPIWLHKDLSRDGLGHKKKPRNCPGPEMNWNSLIPRQLILNDEANIPPQISMVLRQEYMHMRVQRPVSQSATNSVPATTHRCDAGRLRAWQ